MKSIKARDTYGHIVDKVKSQPIAQPVPSNNNAEPPPPGGKYLNKFLILFFFSIILKNLKMKDATLRKLRCTEYQS